MHVFSLDKTISLEVRLLRKDLLALFDVREFSAKARFENPSATLKIEQVVCEACTMARDIDLCRDEDLLPDAATSSEHNDMVKKEWPCPHCSHPLPALQIEEQLIARVEKMLVEWQTQDLRCVKCNRIRVNGFMEHCGCGGQWEGTVMGGREEVVRRLRVVQRVAGGLGMRMLGNVVGQVLEGV
ncbi:MAG: hypothetical protein Q9228_007796 [Teloschistes exilis]